MPPLTPPSNSVCLYSQNSAHHAFYGGVSLCLPKTAGLRIKENKEVYEGEVTELTPEEMETEGGGYGKVCDLMGHLTLVPAHS